MQTARTTGWARPRIRAIGAQRIKVWRQKLINLFKHLTDSQIGGFGNSSREVAPEPGQNILVVPLSRRNIIQFRLKIAVKSYSTYLWK
jgi:hypothetical protein